jgi:hypothetical protein
MDEDLDALSPEQLIAEVKRLREGIRQHRDSTGHDLCWHHPDLWSLLPERLDPQVLVPDWPQFIRGCVRYRQSLDVSAPGASRIIREFSSEDDYPENVWIGPEFDTTGVLVLGESWYGDFPDHLATDDGYISAYLAGEVTDPLYTRIANATGLRKPRFWRSVMFTNFVQRIGPTRGHRPTEAQYKRAAPRLAHLLELHKPRGVWIIGKEQAAYTEPVVLDAGIPVAVSPHPTSYGVKHEVLRAAWDALLHKITGQHEHDDA